MTLLRDTSEMVRETCAAYPSVSGDLALTDRERRILSLMGSGHSAAQIAEFLEISPRAVESHKQVLYAKLGADYQGAAVARALTLGLFDAGDPAPERAPCVAERGAVPVVVMHAADVTRLEAMAAVLLARGIPFVITRTREPVRDHWVAWHRGPRVVVLVDPVMEDWGIPASLGAPVVVVRTGPRDPDLVTEAMASGARALVWSGDVPSDFPAVLALVSRGYFAMSATCLDNLADGRPGRPVSAVTLTARERDILDYMAAGHTIRQTARLLGIAAKTVENTQGRFFRKLGARNRSEALTIAYRLGLVEGAGEQE